MIRILINIIGLIVFTSGLVRAEIYTSFDLKAELEWLRDNPVEFFNSRVPKYNEAGDLLPLEVPMVITEDPLFSMREGCRRKIAADEDFIMASGVSGNRVGRFLGRRDYIKRIADFDHLKTRAYPGDMWSGWYWPISSGSLGLRYRDKEMPFIFDWLGYFNYHNDRPVDSVLSESSRNIDKLSPSEKYELLIDDRNHLITRNEWNTGRAYRDETGNVESWMGLCHGWASASYRVPRPVKKVTVQGKNPGQMITFFPDDLKALSTHLWAKASVRTKSLGTRCNLKETDTDENGRIKDRSCFDINPGDWHLALVNSVGVDGQTFIFDASFDYEVWNHPVKEYQYRYFNPVTKEPVESIEDARVSIRDFSEDPFKKYRGENSKYLVGIEMSVRYLTETGPTISETDGPEKDAYNTAVYLYDLELNERGEIVGGEWYRKGHPDFIWKTVDGARPQAEVSDMVYRWKPGKPLPEVWRRRSRRYASYGQTLGRVVEKLVEFARR